MIEGEVDSVAGPVVKADGLTGAKMYDLAMVGEDKLIGEIIRLTGGSCVVQVYEETTGVKPGDQVLCTEEPLSVELGPGLIGSIYDGVQRPLVIIKDSSGDFISRGVSVDSLDRSKSWRFVPTVKEGDEVSQGQPIGTVRESKIIDHVVMVPVGVGGKVGEMAAEGDYKVDEPIAQINGTEVKMIRTWPVRRARPIQRKQDPTVPLITGQRIFDTFFPIAKGGTAAIPGGFGTGKTVSQHQLAKWSDADIVVYVGCGERGNEMAEVLKDFPELEDPRHKVPLMERTVLIANTSNMPVAAREASVYTGITLAEYFRDMGYGVALMADSTSRWAEAMREISGRLEEMPGERGFPAYLGSRLADFYERAGRVTTLAGGEGSISVVGAVSPGGGDFSEPVTQNTLRITKCFWALDSTLAQRRHFPAINWLTSYSLYTEQLKEWYAEKAGSWTDLRGRSLQLLQREKELQEIVQLVGPDALPEGERLLLECTRMIREDFLQQFAYDEVDTYCPLEKQVGMLDLILKFYDAARDLVQTGIGVERIREMTVRTEIARMKMIPSERFGEESQRIGKMIEDEANKFRGGEES
jgi:V/A-type H+-transporting ATPase subunit A